MMTQIGVTAGSAAGAGGADGGNRLIPEPGAVTGNLREEQ